MMTNHLDKLPEKCLAYHPTDKSVILIVRGEAGYYVTPYDDPRSYNEDIGVTPRQVNAMFNGSMWGWDRGVANPDHKVNQCDPYELQGGCA